MEEGCEGPSFHEFPAEATGNFLRGCTRFALTDRYIDIDHVPLSLSFSLSRRTFRECERGKRREGEQVAREYRERKMRTCRYLDQTRLKSSRTRIG